MASAKFPTRPSAFCTWLGAPTSARRPLAILPSTEREHHPRPGQRRGGQCGTGYPALRPGCFCCLLYWRYISPCNMLLPTYASCFVQQIENGFAVDGFGPEEKSSEASTGVVIACSTYSTPPPTMLHAPPTRPLFHPSTQGLLVQQRTKTPVSAS